MLTMDALNKHNEVKPLLRRVIPVVRRVLGENHELTLRMKGCYAEALYKDSGATLDDLREAVAALEDAERIVRRVFGGSHPFLAQIEGHLRASRAVLRAREAGKRVVFETIPRHRRDG